MWNPDRFENRGEAGTRLAEHLTKVLAPAPTVVLGIPRGGVIVAVPVARALDAPLDVVVPRKVGAPGNPELAIAALAIGEGEEILVRDEDAIAWLGLSERELATLVGRERLEIERREQAYRGGRAGAPLRGMLVVIVDDGVATGLTALAAARAVQLSSPAEVVVAAPVAPGDTAARFARSGVRLEAPRLPGSFRAVGDFYRDFRPVSDEEVVAALGGSR